MERGSRPRASSRSGRRFRLPKRASAESVKRPTTAPRRAASSQARARAQTRGRCASTMPRGAYPAGLSPRAAAIEARASRRGATGRRIDAPTATTASAVCLAIFADAPLARAPRPYPPGLARWSASPSPFVRGVFPAASPPPRTPPRTARLSDLDATPFPPSRASTDDRPDASAHPARHRPLSTATRPTKTTAETQTARATANSARRLPRPPPRVHLAPRGWWTFAVARFAAIPNSPSTRLGRRRRRRGHPRTLRRRRVLFPTPRPRAPRTPSLGRARGRRRRPPRARPRALARVVDDAPRRTTRERSFGCSTASRRSRAPRGADTASTRAPVSSAAGTETGTPRTRTDDTADADGDTARSRKMARRRRGSAARYAGGDSRAGGSRARVRAVSLGEGRGDGALVHESVSGSGGGDVRLTRTA